MMSPLVFLLVNKSKILHSETDTVSLNWSMCVDVFLWIHYYGVTGFKIEYLFI